jgi:membrane associated rhomboid family serine protease
MKITFVLIIVTFLIFALQIATDIENGPITNNFSLIPSRALLGAWWQFFTYMWLHADFMHIFVNMFVLAMFGIIVETKIGRKCFLALYILAGLGSAWLHIALTGISDIPMLGASGAVFGIMTAFGILFPKQIIIIFPGIPMPAIFAVIVLGIIELFFGISGLEPGIANWGHLGGIVTGLFFTILWKSFRKKRIEFVWQDWK